jgi:hypothetical protein
MNFYIDESGSSGDLSRTTANLDFGGQPVFSLAAIGVFDENNLGDELNALRKEHNIRSNELKLSKIFKKKPEFALDAVELAARRNFPFFVEIVDKKYQLAVSITNGFVWPPYFNAPESQETVWLKNIFADYIYHKVPNQILFRFVQCMDNPSNEKTTEFFDLLKDCIKNDAHEVAQGIVTQVEESKDDFRLMIEREGDMAYKLFLPIPDIGKRDQEVWLLPNFASFTNIYARINLFLSGNLADCKIVHDEQAHFDEIIEVAKTQVEDVDTKESSYRPPFSDYDFKQAANLLFKASPESTGIQLADIVAGLSMRWYLSQLQGETISEVLEQAIAILLDHSNREKGIGINVVGPHNMAQKLFGLSGY